jgi:hypothetical protein
MIRRPALAILAAVPSLALTAGLVAAQQGAAPQTEAELKAHLQSVEARLSDESIDLGVRERLALEMASTLDRAASAASTAEIRRSHWTEAAKVLDRFSERHPSHPEARAFEVQSSVYLWARARDRMRAARLNPADAADREAAVADLKTCAERLRAVYRASLGEDDLLSQNARFRLAQALADLAETDRSAPDAEKIAWNTEALAALEKPLAEPSLQGFGRLLKATLLSRLGRAPEALAELDGALATKPSPPEGEQVEVRAGVLSAKGEFAAALKAIDGSTLDPVEKSLRRAEVRLSECAAHAGGREREAAETGLFAELTTLRASGRADARSVLAAAAARLPEPAKGQAPVAWDLLADGAAALGDAARAGRLEQRAAEQAASAGEATRAVEFRLRAGAFYFQAEKYAEADPLLTALANDPAAGPARARAGLLRALGRGRALAVGLPGFSEAGYLAALKSQIETFPKDPSASEARWLLGKLRLAESDRDGAVALWEAIPHGSRRWAESRGAIAEVLQRDLDHQRLNNDRGPVERRVADARAFLARSLSQAQGDLERNDIQLAAARLELTPRVGRTDEARRALEQVLKSVSRADQHDEARRLMIVALAAQNRWVDAEQAARQELSFSEIPALLPTVRLLDRLAAESETDLRSRRIGYLVRILLSPSSEKPDSVPAGLRPEVRLRYARALLFNGDDAGARRALATDFAPSGELHDAMLRDLAETYIRLEAYAMAVEVQRLRSKTTQTGSIPWFDARYGLALAYYRAGKPKDALHLIDATAILHPDLGGGDLRDRFLRLRQRIQPDE